jgi:AraC family transcriptional regulator
MRTKMSLTADTTHDLWRDFMTRRNDVDSRIGADLYSIQVYDSRYFEQFNPDTVFEKWAAVNVRDGRSIPAGMDLLTIPAGLYAVFLHRGGPPTGPSTFQ